MVGLCYLRGGSFGRLDVARRFGQAVTEGVDYAFRPVLDAELAEARREVAADRVFGDMQALAGLLVLQSLGNKRDDLTFSLGQFHWYNPGPSKPKGLGNNPRPSKTVQVYREHP